MSHSSGWFGVDLDGTLAYYDYFVGPTVIGDPIPKMLARVKRWIADGKNIRIFTARVYSDGTPERVKEAYQARVAIENWCLLHLGKVLPVTCTKDYQMIRLFDDRCTQVEANTGRFIGEESED